MPSRVALLACLLLVSAGVGRAEETAQPATPHRARATASRPAPSPPASEDRALLRQLADAQRTLGEQIQAVKERVESLHAELASQHDADSGLEQEVKAMRDEVKGLYVESSTVKQQIDALKEDVSGVNSNVSGFRTFSGFFIAVMILLLAVIFVLTIRR
jgi:TolA-binding protein